MSRAGSLYLILLLLMRIKCSMLMFMKHAKKRINFKSPYDIIDIGSIVFYIYTKKS
jgi:hypothetical protein